MSQSNIEKMKSFIESYPEINQLLHVDYSGNEDGDYGLISNGITIIDTVSDIVGGSIVTKRHNFILYSTNLTVDDITRLDNLNFLEEFSEWVEDSKKKPIFGDNEYEESWEIQNGLLFETNPELHTSTYQIQIGVTFIKNIQGGN